MKILEGDCVSVMSQMVHSSVDSIVTDPPYHFTSIVKRFGAEGAAPARSDGATGVYERSSRGFMGKTWDGGDVAFRPETWAAALRVLKPGGHLVAFGAPKNYHRLACAIEDAGFEIRDSLMWVFGSGFPKSLDVSKAIDKSLGAERERVRPKSVISHQRNIGNRRPYMDDPDHMTVSDDPASDEAAEWQGWGTALKPAYEPIILARKPLIGTVAETVLAHGTGALNIDGCRVSGEPWKAHRATGLGSVKFFSEGEAAVIDKEPHSLGRWPANLVHDGSEEVLAGFPETKSGSRKAGDYGLMGYHGADAAPMPEVSGDSGSAARFFASFPQEDPTWTDRASTAENSSPLPSEAVVSALARAVNSVLPGGLLCDHASMALSTSVTASGLKALVEIATDAILSIGLKFWLESPPTKLSLTTYRASVVGAREPTGITTITISRWIFDGSADPVTFSITPLNSGLGAKDSARFLYHPKASAKDRAGSKHPTVKPIALMRWLVRLITPPGGVVLDPFAGSGTTGQAAQEEGFDAVLIEREAEYLADIRRRLGVMPSVEELLA